MNYPGHPVQRSPKAGFEKIFEPGWRATMNARDARRGGLEVWAPSVVPPIGVELSDEQALAVAFRHLANIGFAENMAGHITWQPDGHTDMFVNPWGLWWRELTASDICVGDIDARRVRRRSNATPPTSSPPDMHTQRT